MYGRMIGGGPTGDGGLIAGAADDGSGMLIADPPPAPEGPGLGMNTGDNDLLLIVLFRPLSNVWSPSRNA